MEEEKTPGGMLVTTVEASGHGGQRFELHWSSLADRPAIWVRIEGGESIDPRDPEGLAVLPISNSALMDVGACRDLRAALDSWIERMEASDR